MIWNAHHSDRSEERLWHFVLPTLTGAACLALSVFVQDGTLSYLFVCLGLATLGAAQAIFWTIPMSFLRGEYAVAGFALINIAASTSGLIGPNFIGWIRETTGSFTSVGYAMSAVLFAGALIITSLRRDPPAPGTSG